MGFPLTNPTYITTTILREICIKLSQFSGFQSLLMKILITIPCAYECYDRSFMNLSIYEIDICDICILFLLYDISNLKYDSKINLIHASETLNRETFT